MAVKVPINLTQIKDDLFDEGVHRTRIGRATIYPKDTEFGQGGEVPGELTSQGNQAYGRIRVGFVFTEHASNYTVSDEGTPVSLAGRYIWENFSFHPNQKRFTQELFAAAGVAIDEAGITDEMLADLLAKEVDILVKTMPQYSNPEVKESRVRQVRPALDTPGV